MKIHANEKFPFRRAILSHHKGNFPRIFEDEKKWRVRGWIILVWKFGVARERAAHLQTKGIIIQIFVFCDSSWVEKNFRFKGVRFQMENNLIYSCRYRCSLGNFESSLILHHKVEMLFILFQNSKFSYLPFLKNICKRKRKCPISIYTFYTFNNFS